VNGNKEVSLRVVGNFCASVQRDEYIFATSVNHFDVVAIPFNQISHFQGNVQIDIFLFRDFADGARIMSAMSCVDNYYKILPP
jgi:hypothetical protein